jgi:hypothetical protein
MMNRRELLSAGINAAAVASVVRPGRVMAHSPVQASGTGETIYLNPETGTDGNSGVKGSPLRARAKTTSQIW